MDPRGAQIANLVCRDTCDAVLSSHCYGRCFAYQDLTAARSSCTHVFCVGLCVYRVIIAVHDFHTAYDRLRVQGYLFACGYIPTDISCCFLYLSLT